MFPSFLKVASSITNGSTPPASRMRGAVRGFFLTWRPLSSSPQVGTENTASGVSLEKAAGHPSSNDGVIRRTRRLRQSRAQQPTDQVWCTGLSQVTGRRYPTCGGSLTIRTYFGSWPKTPSPRPRFRVDLRCRRRWWGDRDLDAIEIEFSPESGDSQIYRPVENEQACQSERVFLSIANRTRLCCVPPPVMRWPLKMPMCRSAGVARWTRMSRVPVA